MAAPPSLEANDVLRDKDPLREPAGDLYLEVRIAPHKLYRVEERDLCMTLPVTPTEAALGAQGLAREI